MSTRIPNAVVVVEDKSPATGFRSGSARSIERLGSAENTLLTTLAPSHTHFHILLSIPPLGEMQTIISFHAVVGFCPPDPIGP
jgi:hypothetical protein